MNISVDKQPNCNATMKVDIPAEKVQGQRNQIVQGYARQARVPGYRPGKAPLKVIEKRFEKEISQELNDRLYQAAIDEAIEKEDLKVLNASAPEDLLATADGGLCFTSKLILAPDFKLPDYKGIKVTIPTAAVPDSEVDDQLKSLQERFADFTDIEGRSAEMGDYLVIDYSSTVDGKTTEEFLGKPAGYIGGREGFWVKLDEKAFLPGFSDQALGMKVGDSKDIPLTIPDDFPLSDLRGKELVFNTTVKEMKEAKLPELNDELAEKLAPGKTLDEIKELIRENMQGERQRRINDLKVNQIITHLVSNVEFDLPEQLLDQETQSQADSMVRRGVQSGMSEEDIAAQQAEIFATAGNQAANNLRSNFILQEIAMAEKLQASDAELVGHLSQLAQQRQQAPKKFIKELQRSGRLPSIRNQLVISKAVDFLVEHAEIEESEDASLNPA